MARLFGTDGVRGLANKDITAELAVDLAVSAARVLNLDTRPAGQRSRAVIGNDSRVSGDFLQHAVAAGLASAGIDALLVGTLPTPGLAYLTATEDVDLGVMLSASHNPFHDNGIKFFTHEGYKLPDDTEDSIEAHKGEEWDRPTGERVGRIYADRLGPLSYVDHLVKSAPVKLDGLTIVLDCANGASFEVGPEVFRQLGATVIARAIEPDGFNINHGVGSTHPESLQKAVVEEHADMGFAFDGDADRCLAVDHTGTLVNGDQIMGLLAIRLKERGELAHNTLVATVMSNLGLGIAMKEHGITLLRTAVGDRYVLEEMLAHGYTLGGEQSGHVIMTAHQTTGDGVLTAVQVACQVKSHSCPLAELATVVPQFPQTLVNVPDVDKTRASSDAQLLGAVASAEKELGNRGRVLLRPSGTEPLVRVMVEADSQDKADAVAAGLADVVRERLGLS